MAAAALAGTFAYLYLGSLSHRVPVVVAARDFGAYATMDKSLLKVALLPAAAVHPGAVRSMAEATGQMSLVSRVAGEQIIRASLVDGEKPGEYRASLAPEERAVFVPSSAVFGGWLGVRAGDYVDLLVVLDGTGGLLDHGFEVLEVLSEESSGSLIGGRDSPPTGVFLRAGAAASEKLALALEYGKVYYSIAGYHGVPVETTGAWLEQVYPGGDASDDVIWP